MADSPPHAIAPPGRPDDVRVSYALEVNGCRYEVVDAWLGESLLNVLRDRLGLYGAKNACEEGECGACSVLRDGVLVASCCVLAADAADSQVTTIEGLSPTGSLTDVQRALIEHGAIQCGFCTPGLVVSIHDLLERTPDAEMADVREALAGNLCRCTGYGRILAAVRAVQKERHHAPG